MRKLWSRTCERTQSEQAEYSSYPKCIEVVLRETVQKSYPENVDIPMIAPRVFEVRQSGRVLKLQNKDLWIRPTDLSWHYPILVTIREFFFFKNYRRRSSAILEARDEAKKQKTQKNKKLGSNTQGYDLAAAVLLALMSST